MRTVAELLSDTADDAGPGEVVARVEAGETEDEPYAQITVVLADGHATLALGPLAVTVLRDALGSIDSDARED